MTLLIHGTVLGASGAPVAGAAVLIAAAPAPVPDVALLSGADGRFTLAVPAPGRYRLGARSDRHGHTEVAFEVGAAGAQVTLHLPG
jgi:hypothetical protein